ncbi:hypothetical protein HOA92_03585 [archaeon]|jgi:hypothetical protein|nr:hypothetical protein [archaeon]MBT6762094.1 hypothetical protein [archaeon]
MRLVYGSEELKGIALRAEKEEITEEGIPVKFQVHSVEGLMFGDKSEKRIFISTNMHPCLEHIRHFIMDKKNPGVILISDKSHLHANEMMNKLLINKFVRPHNIIFLGQHVFAKAEYTFLQQNKLHIFPMKEISFEGKMEVSDAVMTIAKKWSHCYILIDSSVLDSSAIKNNWAGGMSTRDLVFFIQRLKRLHNFLTAELVVPAASKRIAVKLLVETYI